MPSVLFVLLSTQVLFVDLAMPAFVFSVMQDLTNHVAKCLVNVWKVEDLKTIAADDHYCDDDF